MRRARLVDVVDDEGRQRNGTDETGVIQPILRFVRSLVSLDVEPVESPGVTFPSRAVRRSRDCEPDLRTTPRSVHANRGDCEPRHGRTVLRSRPNPGSVMAEPGSDGGRLRCAWFRLPDRGFQSASRGSPRIAGRPLRRAGGSWAVGTRLGHRSEQSVSSGGHTELARRGQLGIPPADPLWRYAPCVDSCRRSRIASPGTTRRGHLASRPEKSRRYAGPERTNAYTRARPFRELIGVLPKFLRSINSNRSAVLSIAETVRSRLQHDVPGLLAFQLRCSFRRRGLSWRTRPIWW